MFSHGSNWGHIHLVKCALLLEVLSQMHYRLLSPGWNHSEEALMLLRHTGQGEGLKGLFHLEEMEC